VTKARPRTLPALSTPATEASPAQADAVAPEAFVAAHKEPWVKALPFVGLALAILTVVFLGSVFLADQAQGKALLLMVPILFGAGKEAAIPAGIAAGGDPWLVALTMIVTDLAGTFVLYPIVHLTLDSLEKRRGFLGKMLRGAVRRAEKRRHIVDRYGVAGLYLYSIIPFAFNGPPIVAAMGRMAGLRAIQVVPVLVAAIVTTTIAWAMFYAIGFTALASVNKWIPLLLSVSIMLVMVGVSVVGALMDRSDDPAPGAEAKGP